jgi:hypothetical protein
MSFNFGDRSTQHLAFSTQPAQQFGVGLTGILPSKVTKSKRSQEPALPPVEIQSD